MISLKQQQQEHLQSSVNDNNNGEKTCTNGRKSMIDIKGAIALSATITSFLIALTFIENSNSLENSIGIAGISFIVSAASLILFIFIEKRTNMPLIDLWLIKTKNLVAILYYDDSYWDYNISGISYDSAISKKPSTLQVLVEMLYMRLTSSFRLC